MLPVHPLSKRRTEKVAPTEFSFNLQLIAQLNAEQGGRGRKEGRRKFPRCRFMKFITAITNIGAEAEEQQFVADLVARSVIDTR